MPGKALPLHSEMPSGGTGMSGTRGVARSLHSSADIQNTHWEGAEAVTWMHVTHAHKEGAPRGPPHPVSVHHFKSLQ